MIRHFAVALAAMTMAACTSAFPGSYELLPTGQSCSQTITIPVYVPAR
jgi:hypothetical protein